MFETGLNIFYSSQDLLRHIFHSRQEFKWFVEASVVNLDSTKHLCVRLRVKIYYKWEHACEYFGSLSVLQEMLYVWFFFFHFLAPCKENAKNELCGDCIVHQLLSSCHVAHYNQSGAFENVNDIKEGEDDNSSLMRDFHTLNIYCDCSLM